MTIYNAAAMEEAIKAVLHEAKISPENREILEKAVQIARSLQKPVKNCESQAGPPNARAQDDPSTRKG
jgi:hypothetical protein